MPPSRRCPAPSLNSAKIMPGGRGAGRTLQGTHCSRGLDPTTVLCRPWVTVGHTELGMFAAGRARGEEGLRLAEAADHPASLVHASWGIGTLFLRQGAL